MTSAVEVDARPPFPQVRPAHVFRPRSAAGGGGDGASVRSHSRHLAGRRRRLRHHSVLAGAARFIHHGVDAGQSVHGRHHDDHCGVR